MKPRSAGCPIAHAPHLVMPMPFRERQIRPGSERLRKTLVICNGGAVGVIKHVEGAEMPADETQRWFAEQVEREHKRLRAFIRCLGVRADEVDDFAQEVFLLCYRKLDEFGQDGNFGAWARGIARRMIAAERRKEARRSRLLSDHVTDVLLDIEDGRWLCASAVSAEEDALTALRNCLSLLPQHARDLLQQRYFEELSPGEIGGRLGKPSNQIRQALLRLRRALVSCMGQSLDPEEVGFHHV
jgi:RNA polymerase sigma-70 factor, ECF subfamily